MDIIYTAGHESRITAFGCQNGQVCVTQVAVETKGERHTVEDKEPLWFSGVSVGRINVTVYPLVYYMHKMIIVMV